MENDDIAKTIEHMVEIDVKLSNGDFLRELSGDVLSYIGVKLSAMKATLIDVKIVAQYDMLKQEVLMQEEKGKAFLRAKEKYNATTASDAKYTDSEFIAAQEKYIESKIRFEKLRNITADTHDIIDAIKSRVIDLQGARKDERLG